jgi:simple sugar transport system permease protein
MQTPETTLAQELPDSSTTDQSGAVSVVGPPRVNPIVSFLVKPAATAILAVMVVFIYFSLTTTGFDSAAGIANWLDPAATLGTVCAMFALLMISGNIDLSSGVAIGTTGVVMGLLATQAHWPVPLAMLGALVVALAIGLTNGLAVVKTGLHSFIVTLAMFFALQGLNVGITILVNKPPDTGGPVPATALVVAGIRDAPGYALPQLILGSSIPIAGAQFQISIVWWILLTLLASWVLLRTKYGNWIQCIGGNTPAARATGIPVGRTKVALFVGTSLAAWLVGMETALRLGSAQPSEGFGLELQFIIASVVGGCLLFGGHGSVVGAALGAVTFGMVSLGITYAKWPGEIYYLFLGVMLFVAVLANTVVRRRLMRGV